MLRTDDLWKGYHGSMFKFRWEKDDNADNCLDLECRSVFDNLRRGCEFIISSQPQHPSSDEGKPLANT